MNPSDQTKMWAFFRVYHGQFCAVLPHRAWAPFFINDPRIFRRRHSSISSHPFHVELIHFNSFSLFTYLYARFTALDETLCKEWNVDSSQAGRQQYGAPNSTRQQVQQRQPQPQRPLQRQPARPQQPVQQQQQQQQQHQPLQPSPKAAPTEQPKPNGTEPETKSADKSSPIKSIQSTKHGIAAVLATQVQCVFVQKNNFFSF